MLAGAIGQIPPANAGNRNGDDDEYRAFGRFQRNNPPVFEGEHEPDKAQAWLKAIEKIFRRFEEDGIEVTWDLFRDVFLENYFPEDCRGKKEVEFLELKQGNGTVAVYAANFQELIKYCPHYNTANAERSKCLKFGHKAAECKKEVTTCFKCGKYGHIATNCRGGSNVTCFNCGEKGHVSTKCNKPKKEQAKGKVFALSGVGATTDERLIQATLDVREKRTIEDLPIVWEFAEDVRFRAERVEESTRRIAWEEIYSS
ncbi:uncharacterized protein LOC131630767 [Vicia villosa]|uniref:uncharacterized protein LOC131630767 n=1 Tax=Vicia villosa TaxID=3911 RepID=UPI00273B7B8E|nr:uncharacterized protein LOC131630767 [Vicia villosa]